MTLILGYKIDFAAPLEVARSSRSRLVAGEVEYASKSAWLLNLISKPTIEKEPSRFNAVGAPSAKSVLSLAFNNHCDVIVATCRRRR